LWIAALWPGFVRGWTLGRWDGFVLSVAFAAAISGTLIATFIGNRWLPVAAAGSIATVGWVLVVGLWVLGLSWLRRDWRRMFTGGQENEQIEALFDESQHEYLKGHWIEAEMVVRRLLKREPGDVEAALLLASIQRRSNRWGEAKKTLGDLQRVAGEKWLLEIGVELRQIEELVREKSGVRNSECGVKAA